MGRVARGLLRRFAPHAEAAAGKQDEDDPGVGADRHASGIEVGRACFGCRPTADEEELPQPARRVLAQGDQRVDRPELDTRVARRRVDRRERSAPGVAGILRRALDLQGALAQRVDAEHAVLEDVERAREGGELLVSPLVEVGGEAVGVSLQERRRVLVEEPREPVELLRFQLSPGRAPVDPVPERFDPSAKLRHEGGAVAGEQRAPGARVGGDLLRGERDCRGPRGLRVGEEVSQPPRPRGAS